MTDSFINPEGSVEAKIAFVLDAPTEKDAHAGKYLSGYSGDVFDALLSASGIVRHNTYRTAFIKSALNKQGYSHYLSKNQINYSPEYRAWEEYLRRELRRTQANVIVPLGELSFHVLTGLRGHRKYRGSVLPCILVPGRKVIPCYHPAILQGQYQLKPFIQCDLGKIQRECGNRDIEIFENDAFIIRPDFHTAMAVLEELNNSSILSWDIETAGSAVSCIGFSSDIVEGICIPLTIPGQKRFWTTEKEIKILRTIDKLLRNPNIPKGGQNIHYDMCWMIKTLSIVPTNIAWDTMIAQHSCYCELPKDLGTLVSLYTNFPYYKDEGNVWREGVGADKHLTQDEKLERYWLYNVKDCHRTLACWHALEKEMSDLGVRKVHDMVVQKFLPQAVYMTSRGVLYDRKMQAQMFEEYDTKIKVLQKSMIEDFNLPEDFNLNSVKQMKELLYDTWGMREKRDRKTGNTTVNDQALKTLKKEYPRYTPFLSKLQEYRAMKKLQSTYLGLEISDFDGRMHFGYNVVGTETGRYSSSQSCFGDGTNGQNVPDKTRKLVYAEDGMVFINADLSQAEARVVAMLGPEMALLELFESGQDIHIINAHTIFGIDPSQVKEIFPPAAAQGHTYRDMAKRIVHASNYNMSAFTFAQQAQIKKAEAQKLLDEYFARYPGIKAYHRWVEKEVRTRKMLETPYGRKRLFFGRMDAYTMREAFAYIPQSTVGDTLNLGAYNVMTQMPYVELAIQVHDSIMVRCPEDRVSEACEQIIQCLSIPITINNITHTIPVDVEVGRNWGKFSKENPEGLKEWPK